MFHLTNLHSGNLVVELCVLVAGVITLVSGIGWLVSLGLRRYPPVCHCVLLSALIASLLIPPVATIFYATGTSLIALPLLPLVPIATPKPSADLGEIVLTELPELANGGVAQDTQLIPEPSSPAPDAVAVPSAVIATFLAWLGGVIVLLAGLLRSNLKLRRIRLSMQPATDADLVVAMEEARQLLGAKTAVKLTTSSLAHTPIAIGIVKPEIALPTKLAQSVTYGQLRDMLMHELAHIERRDNLIVLLQAIARAAFWPILPVHLLNRQLEQAREEICDNHVLVHRDAVSYGETLLTVAQLACSMAIPVGSIGMLQWRGKLEDRIRNFTQAGRCKMTRIHPLSAGIVTALFLSASAVLCGTSIEQVRADDESSTRMADSRPTREAAADKVDLQTKARQRAQAEDNEIRRNQAEAEAHQKVVEQELKRVERLRMQGVRADESRGNQEADDPRVIEALKESGAGRVRFHEGNLRQDYDLTAGIKYKDSMLILVSAEGAAAVVFPLNMEDPDGGVSYRFRYESRDGMIKRVGTGRVSEKRKPGTDREVERDAEDGIIGEPFIFAGPIKILWSPESAESGFLYYSPEKIQVHIAHARRFEASTEISPFGDRRDYAPLDLRRFMK